MPTPPSSRNLIASRKRQGLCRDCGKGPPSKPGGKCESCRLRKREYDRGRRDRFRQAGLCGDCGKNPLAAGRSKCKECLAEASKLSCSAHKSAKAEIIEAYGGRCSCCGEADPAFLSVDHVNNDGAEHRREIGRGSLYWWLRRNNYPPGFQILCFSCNFAKSKNGGVCPHNHLRAACSETQIFDPPPEATA